jgi:hypothetical protein
MALTNTLAIDLSANTIISTTLSGVSTVDILTYTQSTNTITFGSRSAISISATDFLQLLSNVFVFQTAILFNFKPNQNAAFPYTSVTITESNATSHYDLTVQAGGGSPVINDSAILSGQTVQLSSRPAIHILNFPEWLQVYGELSRYQNSVRQFFGI